VSIATRRAATAAAVAFLLLFGVLFMISVLHVVGPWPDRGPDLPWVTNKTQETLIVQPRNGHETARTVGAGKSTTYPGQPPGCEKAPWVATTLSGDVVAEIPGGCTGHEWTIYGVNNSTYR
jgi:hypothetical protein